MKTSISYLKKMLLMAATCCCLATVKGQLAAFPGAEGFGKHATGGRYGSVYHVTNLNDDGAGSLRDAVSTPNRIVVFDVAGVIKISSRMVVAKNIYLAGQTAPGEGITVYGNGWSFSGASNTICRYMRIRMGIVGSDGKDANGIADGHDMIFDHCSVSWGRDENFSINSTTAYNITIQNSIISQGLMTHSAGGLIQADSITLYRNLYADNTTRNNKIKGINQYVNNIVYNWNNGAYIMGGESSGDSYVNATNNCFIKGPENGVPPFNLGNSLFHIYAADNIFDSSRDGLFNPYVIPQREYVGPPDFQTAAYSYPVLSVWSANSLFDSLLPAVGASLPYRDYADYYVVDEVRTLGQKGELIGSESSLPFGAPTSWKLWAGNKRTDTDNDGMPDSWENANGTNVGANDAMTIAANGYTNIENYINSITESNSEDYLRTPMNLQKDSATQSTLFLSWLDYTEKEQGYIVERKVDGNWVVVDTTGVSDNRVTLTGFQPEQSDTLRVAAYKGSALSAYSNVLIAKTKPVVVAVLDTADFKPNLTWNGSENSSWDFQTANWLDSTGTVARFTDSSTLIFPDRISAQTLHLDTVVAPGDMLIQASNDYTFSGSGQIAGSGSVNKTGTGTLSLETSNTYVGPTVLHKGVIELNTLANGDLPSSMGASANYAFNWRWQGGVWKYTGKSVATDRNASLDANTAFEVSDSTAVVTFNGVLSGDGGLIKSGPGTLQLKSENPYSGETVINGGVLEVTPVSSATQAEDIIDDNRGIGTSGILRLHNGTYRTSGGSNTIYENYPLELYVDAGTINGFEPSRNANLTMTVHGTGTLNYQIPYLREMVQGDWSDFTGTLVANSSGGLLVINNGVGFPNNRVVATGTTKIVNWDNNMAVSIGALAGDPGTMLSCGGVKTQSFGFGKTTYVIGGAGTDETFNGVINNQPYGATSNTTGETTLIKEGAGIWRLTGKNDYAGTTTVNAGSIIINGNNVGTGAVYVAGGALAGNGSIAGAVEVQPGGALEPGDSAVGTLTLKSTLRLDSGSIVRVDINNATATSDQIVVGDSLFYGGSIQVDTTGPLNAGDRFKIFAAGGGVTGNITRISPALSNGLYWKFRAATGELMVGAPGFVYAPGQLTLTAATDIPTALSTVTAKWVDNSDSETYFVLERSRDNIHFKDVAHPAADITTYTDSALKPSTTYYYRIKAVVNNSEFSAYSDTISVTTPVPYNPPVPASGPTPANEQVYNGMMGSDLILSWQGGAYTQKYIVYIGKDSLHLQKVAEVPFSDTASYVASKLGYNTTYYWRIDAAGDGHRSTGDIWSFTTGTKTSLVARFPLDETSGDTAFDATDNHLDGLANFTPVWYPTSGKLKGAAGFANATAANSAIVVPASVPLLLDSSSFSIALWLKSPADTYKYSEGKDCYLIHKGTFEANTGKWYGLQLKDGSLTFAIDDGVNKSSLSVSLKNSTDIFNDTWNQIVAVRDLTAKQIYLYINGSLAGSASASKTTNIGQADKDLLIGNSTENKPFRDQLDDIRFYNNALSGSDVQSLYQLSDPVTSAVKVFGFTANAAPKQIRLNWITASESNSNLFELYRSTDSLNFTLMQSIPAKGYSSDTTRYDTQDAHPATGINYYRLMHHYTDGTVKEVGNASVAFNSGTNRGFLVYPNPLIGNNLYFSFLGVTPMKNFMASFYRMDGQLIKSQNYTASRLPVNIYKIQLPGKLKGGIYLLVLTDGTQKYEQKVIVL